MKKISSIILLFVLATGTKAQISGTPAQIPAPQAVPNASTSEKSAAPKKDAVITTPNPVPPVYPGAEPTPVVKQRELVYPAAPPAPTQPLQREPLTPIESTNQLQPNRPQADEASRTNTVNGRPVSAIPDNRVDKNSARAATTVENAGQTRTNKVVFPARTDSVRAPVKPVKTKSQKKVKQ